MILTAIILLLSTISGGLLIYVVGFKSANLRLPLIFAGSFLFAVTIIHILPELFSVSSDPFQIGLFVLIGFFFQQFLETLTSGVEHGHFHEGHQNFKYSKLSLLVGLTVHSILEGSLLTHESPFHNQNESYSLLLGILFHKVPAAFALMAVIKKNNGFKVSDFLVLLLFALASPAGLLLSNFVVALSESSLLVLFAIVSGSFLHISTTIFVETSPNHSLGFKRTAVSVLGALLAIAVEYLS